MDEFESRISGFVEQTASGAFVACVSATRTWEHFTLQFARVTSTACATRPDAELLLQRLLEDFKGVFAH